MLPILPPMVSSPPILPTVVQQSPAVPQSFKVDEILTIEAAHWYEDLAEGKTYFEGGVRAVYGLTSLSCEKLVVDKATGVMVAEGESRIDDPEGTVSADNIKIEWRKGHGVAQNVRVQIGYVLIQGAELETMTTPEPVWVVRGATVELTDLSAGGNRFWADELKIYPGKRAVAKHIFYQVLGKKIGPFPSQTFNLDRRVTGFKFPALSYNSGIGVTWQSSFLLGDQTSASGIWKSFPRRPQEYQVELTHSFIKGGEQQTRIKPQSDLGERADNGWFNNIGIKTPEEELGRVRDLKSSLSLGSFWNVDSVGRGTNSEEISKAIEAVYEIGGPLGAGGWLTTGRVQRIRENQNSPWVDRAVVSTSYLAPRLGFRNGWFAHGRVDLIGMSSKQGQFGIARTELGVFGEVMEGFRIGGAYVLAGTSGSPDFAIDQLAYGDGIHLRADYKRGPYSLRFLTKYDVDSKIWYDQEWEFALAAGSLEPFVSRRGFPNDFRVGVRFRIDQFTDRILDRDLNRKNRPVDSPSGN